jgi:carbohydrate diacid regulator
MYTILNKGRGKVLSNHILQKIISDIYEVTGVDCSVWSMEGNCLAVSGGEEKDVKASVAEFLSCEETSELITDSEACFLIKDEEEPIYVLVMHKVTEHVMISGKLCVCQFEHLIHAYKTRVDKKRYYQNLLLDNMLLVDVYNQAKKLGIEVEARRAVFVIQPKHEADNLVLETMKGLYATGTKDFVTSVDENHIILIKTLENTDDYKELNYIARTIVDTLSAEAMVSIRVAYGTIVNEIKEVSKSYKEASMALDVGRIFYSERNILAYNQLGIGRLIHQLPYSLCDMFLKEVFDGKAVEQFDEETLSTVNLFFENNLNISETARKLYVHRNTLVYRLEKIQKLTGLDVRVFDDALTFKIALMVTKHMKSVQ